MKTYPLAKPYITDKEKQYVMEVLDSGRLSMGDKLKQFEEQFAQFIGTKYACGTSSGTTGLHLALIAAGIGPGDEVVTTPFSFVASANCMLYVGAKPVFVDIDPLTSNIDPNKIEDALTEKTKAILVVHIFGQAADMDPILALAEKHNLIIIEDACESVGATYKGKTVGTFGQSSVFAFYPNKQMTTGEGGMLCTDDKEIYELCKSLTNQGRSANMAWLDHQYLGYNYRMDEMSAALGLAQLEKLDWMIQERRQIANWYTQAFAPYNDVVEVPQIAPHNTNTWFVYVIRIQPQAIPRNSVIEKLKEQQIYSKPYLPSIHLFDFYRRRFGYTKGRYPISENISDVSLALPFYIGLTREDIAYIVETVINILKSSL